MEMSHQSNIITAEFGMLFSQGDYNDHVRGCSENYLLFICTFDNNIWYHFLGNSPHTTDIFKIQKQMFRIMTKSRNRDSCRQLFKRLEILPLKSHYIFSVLLFVVKIKDLYTTNQEIHNISTRSNTNLHPPVCNLTVFRRTLITLV